MICQHVDGLILVSVSDRQNYLHLMIVNIILARVCIFANWKKFIKLNCEVGNNFME